MLSGGSPPKDFRLFATDCDGHERFGRRVAVETRGVVPFAGLGGRFQVRLTLSVALALEYEASGKRHAVMLGIPLDAIDDIVDHLCRIAEHQAVHFRLRPSLSDPDDEFVLELAFAARCDYLVTHNLRHLRGARRFGVKVVTPGEFLRTIEEKP